MFLIPLIVAIVFCSGGVLILIYTHQKIKKMQRSRFWPKTKGEIISSECIKINPSKFRHTTAYKPVINCRYLVKGKEYTGGKINMWADMGMDAPAALELAGRFPEGKQVVVYYNPEEPAEAVINPGTVKNYWLAYFFGCFFIGVSCYMGYIAYLLFHQS